MNQKTTKSKSISFPEEKTQFIFKKMFSVVLNTGTQRENGRIVSWDPSFQSFCIFFHHIPEDIMTFIKDNKDMTNGKVSFDSAINPEYKVKMTKNSSSPLTIELMNKNDYCKFSAISSLTKSKRKESVLFTMDLHSGDNNEIINKYSAKVNYGSPSTFVVSHDKTADLNNCVSTVFADGFSALKSNIKYIVHEKCRQVLKDNNLRVTDYGATNIINKKYTFPLNEDECALYNSYGKTKNDKSVLGE